MNLGNNLPTESELHQAVCSNDPGAMRWFGALLERTTYLPAQRSKEEEEINEATLNAMPKHAIGHLQISAAEKVALWEPALSNLGKHWPPMFQETGSCVCQGAHCATADTMAMDAWEKGEAEEVKWPLFLLLAYGRSRHYMGARGPGDGSFGSVMAKAVMADGVLAADFQGLPPHTIRNGGVTWGSQQELKWSYIPDRADAFDPFQDAAKLHPIQATAKLKSANEVDAALSNGYGVTIASMWGGNMQCRTAGTPAVLMNQRTTQWAHQMAIRARWNHPTLGRIFWIQNSWGNPHGVCPSGAPAGGFWVKEGEIDWICRDEAFAYSGFQGFPSRAFDWGSLLPRA